MGVRNYLIEGVSCSGKTTVCEELQRLGYHAVHGDRELSYQGDPETGKPIDGVADHLTPEQRIRYIHEHHIWDVNKVKAIMANKDAVVTFFCGGSRNFASFIDLFDGVFVLDVDLETLNRRLDKRPKDEWGGKKMERELVLRLHQTKEDIPKNGVIIKASSPLEQVVDDIIRHIEAK